MFKRKKKKTGCETPEFRKPTMPPITKNEALKPNLDDFTLSKFALYQGYTTVEPDVVSLYVKDYSDDDMIIELHKDGTCKIYRKKENNKCTD